jgi:hypothetical protein
MSASLSLQPHLVQAAGEVRQTPWIVVGYFMLSRALLVAWLCTVLSGVAAAETVSVKYRGDVPLDTFQCTSIDRSFIERVCYDAAQEYMVILLKGTYYHYCEIGQRTVDSLLTAGSMDT